MAFCNQCGEKTFASGKFCTNCGAELKAVNATRTAESKPPRNTLKKILPVGIALLVIMGGIEFLAKKSASKTFNAHLYEIGDYVANQQTFVVENKATVLEMINTWEVRHDLRANIAIESLTKTDSSFESLGSLNIGGDPIPKYSTQLISPRLLNSDGGGIILVQGHHPYRYKTPILLWKAGTVKGQALVKPRRSMDVEFKL